MDPEQPVPGAGDGDGDGDGDGGMLNEVDDELIDRFVERIVGTPIVSAEIRHLGGTVGRRSSQHGALNSFDAPYLMFAVGLTPTPELLHVLEAVVADLRRWSRGSQTTRP